MALVLISKELITDPETIIALHKAFELVEELPEMGQQPGTLYKTFRVKGNGVPNDDKYIDLSFGIQLGGKPRVTSWQPVSQK